MKRTAGLTLTALVTALAFIAPAAQTPAPSAPQPAQAPMEFDFLLKGGHVIDPRNKISAVRDVAVKDGKVAAVAADIAASRAVKAVDASGLVDHARPHRHPRPRLSGREEERLRRRRLERLPRRLHAAQLRDHGGRRRHLGVAQRSTTSSRASSTSPRPASPPSSTSSAPAWGRAGSSRTWPTWTVKPTADMALKHKGVVVGIKSAHFNGPEWTPYEKAEEVGRIAGIPVMVDFGGNVRAKPDARRPASRSTSARATSTPTCTAACAASRTPTPRGRARR